MEDEPGPPPDTVMSTEQQTATPADAPGAPAAASVPAQHPQAQQAAGQPAISMNMWQAALASAMASVEQGTPCCSSSVQCATSRHLACPDV